MKITNAWIEDPTLVGDLQPPKLCVEVTEPPNISIPYENFSGGWQVGKLGPFVHYGRFGSPKASAPDFNARFRGRFPVVLDIDLQIPHEDEDGTVDIVNGYSLPLPRARQLVRKFDKRWRLAVSERAAEDGQLLWEPMMIVPECRFWMIDRTCGKVPAKIIHVHNVDFPMCAHHVEVHNRAQAERRVRNSA